MKNEMSDQKHIHCTGFYVNFVGDPAVGISDEEWKIEGDFVFENRKDLRQFKSVIRLAWEGRVSDTPVYVESFEERAECEEYHNWHV